MMKKLLTILVLLMVMLEISSQGSNPQLTADNIDQVVKAMTLDEKVSLVVGGGMTFPGAAIGQTEEKVAGAAGTTAAIPRLGIPSIVLADGPAGLRISPIRNGDSTRTYYCTAFPVGTLIASTWDTELAERIGASMGNELVEYGVDVLLAPALNIHRNPLCGRNFEYLSEDPLISGKIAGAIVKGVQSNGVGTSIKHYAANNTETNRMALNTVVSERAMREIYLRGFEIAVKEAQPWTVMSSYNLINGTHASENYGLLTSVLREDWGFDGFVMTDWFAGIDAVAQMKAGNDLLMPGVPPQKEAILEAVKEGSLEESVLDLNVKRILQIVVKSPSFKGMVPSNEPDLKAHAKVARQAGAEGMVLLKNTDSALPLGSGTSTLAAFGNTSYDIITGGTGSGDVNEAYSISLFDGLTNSALVPDQKLEKKYEQYVADVLASRPPRENWFMPVEPVPEMSVDEATIKDVVSRTDMALITIGRNSGEFRDRKVEEFYFSETELKLIKDVCRIYHEKGKKVVVVLNTGGVVETASWRGYPDAILLAWQAGQETGNTIADVLTGKVNPSGKLTSTFPVKYEDVPNAGGFPGKELPKDENAEDEGPFPMRSKPSEITYEDDIYVGYRYFDAAGMETAFPFGYGLSYTTFAYGPLQLDAKKFGDSLKVEVEVSNTGKVAGKEVVQLYLAAPGKEMNKPAKELRAFAKTRALKPGESQVLSFTLQSRDLCSFDPEQSAWTAEKGTYRILLGASSADIRQEASFKLSKPLVEETVSKSLLPVVSIDKMKL